MHGRKMFSLARAASLALVLLAFVASGCLHSNTAPVPEGTTPSNVPEAPVVAARDLGDVGVVDAGQVASLAPRQVAIESELTARDRDVVGTALSTYRGRPVVLALTRRPSHRVPAKVGGQEVLEYVVGDVRAQAYYCGTSTGRASTCNSGTFGAIVTDGARNYWLSNWHVFARTGGLVGDAIVSPGRVDMNCGTSTTVGTLSRWTPVKFDGSTNYVDCAIARITPGLAVSPIESAPTGSFKPSATTRAATVGLAVKKVGRTTKLTTGTVVAINASLTINYAGIGSARFAGVVICSSMSAEGDSGSLICTQSGNNPVALLFAGSSTTSVGCPINSVYQSIGAHIAN